jgi:hypothetical protein
MPNPDNKITTSTIETFGISLPLGFVYAILLMILFMNKDNIPLFNGVLWIIFPIIVFLLGTVVNIINQYISCHTVHAGNALLGAIPSLISVLVAMGIGSISFCRIPAVTVFAPFLVGNNVNIISNNGQSDKKCCPNTMSLSQVENSYPQLKGLAIGFYVIFGVLFGNVFGTGLSSIC